MGGAQKPIKVIGAVHRDVNFFSFPPPPLHLLLSPNCDPLLFPPSSDPSSQPTLRHCLLLTAIQNVAVPESPPRGAVCQILILHGAQWRNANTPSLGMR